MRFHCCLFDRQCWRDHRDHGMPMRLRIGNWTRTLPFLSGDRIAQRVWEESNDDS